MTRSSNRDTSGQRGPGPRERPLRTPPGPQTRATVREWDRHAIEDLGIPGAVLMENAGAGAARILAGLNPTGARGCPGPHLILCGPGNNGGDGLVVARYLLDWGFEVAVRIPSGVTHAKGSDADIHLQIARRLGIPMGPPIARELAQAGTIVDALFGTGLSRPLEGPWIDWVRAINASGRPTVAIDVPSGLDADSGQVLGDAVRAWHTIAFSAPKVGFELGVGPEHCGQVHLVDIGIPEKVLRGHKVFGP